MPLGRLLGAPVLARARPARVRRGLAPPESQALANVERAQVGHADLRRLNPFMNSPAQVSVADLKATVVKIQQKSQQQQAAPRLHA
eukprot:2444075-Pyramimonas_sp.AAC.1